MPDDPLERRKLGFGDLHRQSVFKPFQCRLDRLEESQLLLGFANRVEQALVARYSDALRRANALHGLAQRIEVGRRRADRVNGVRAPSPRPPRGESPALS
jgi:hypothetical protein